MLLQVGIPVAAGILLPSTGTMLTPSIAGALMGLSSVGVMTNSLFLRFRAGKGKKHMHKHQRQSRDIPDSDILVQIDNEAQKPYPVKWRNS